MHVLLIPHSNSFCETLFSIAKKMTTDMRSQLGRGKEGHAGECLQRCSWRQTHSLRTSYQQNKCVQEHKLS